MFASKLYPVRPVIFLFWQRGGLFRLLRKPFNQMIEAKPDAPAMMIESYGKHERRDEKNGEDELIIGAEKQERDKISEQNHDLSRDNVD